MLGSYIFAWLVHVHVAGEKNEEYFYWQLTKILKLCGWPKKEKLASLLRGKVTAQTHQTLDMLHKCEAITSELHRKLD